MAENIDVILNWGKLPPGVTFGDYDALVSEVAKLVTAYLPGQYAPFNFGNSTPSVDNQDRPWLRLNPDGSPDRIYIFFNGKWVAEHPVSVSSPERRLWVGSLANLYSHDGGDGTDPTVTAPTATTGAMWQEDEDFRDKIPMGVLAATGQVTSVGGTAGALTQAFTLTTDNLPRHRHEVGVESTGDAEQTDEKNESDAVGRFLVGDGDLRWSSNNTNNVGHTRYYGKPSPDAVTVSTVPPVLGCYVIKRTARKFFTP